MRYALPLTFLVVVLLWLVALAGCEVTPVCTPMPPGPYVMTLELDPDSSPGCAALEPRLVEWPLQPVAELNYLTLDDYDPTFCTSSGYWSRSTDEGTTTTTYQLHHYGASAGGWFRFSEVRGGEEWACTYATTYRRAP